MALSSSLTFATPAQLKQQELEDLELQALANGVAVPPIEPGGEWDLLTTGDANIGSVLEANQQTLDEDSDPLRATGDALDEIRRRLQLPEVPPAPAAGPVTITIVGTGTVAVGLGLQAPNGFTARVSRGVTQVSGAQICDAEMVNPGPAGNIPAGTQLRIIGGPPNLQVIAVATADWVGGTEVEDDTRKRKRILNRILYGATSWGHVREVALAATGAIDNAYVYRALGGPGALKCVVTTSTSSETRGAPAAIVGRVLGALDDTFASGTWMHWVQTALDEVTDVALGIGLPESGTHQWLASGPISRSYVQSHVSQTEFTVAGNLGSLAPGETIACWDHRSRAFGTAKVLTRNGQNLTTSPWSGEAAADDTLWIFPACDGLQAIVDAWLTVMRGLGPGEQVAASDARFKFAKRMPLASGTNPASLTGVQLRQLQLAIPEATDVTYMSVSTSTPTVPATAGDPPNVLVLRAFGIYPL